MLYFEMNFVVDSGCGGGVSGGGVLVVVDDNSVTAPVGGGCTDVSR